MYWLCIESTDMYVYISPNIDLLNITVTTSINLNYKIFIHIFLFIVAEIPGIDPVNKLAKVTQMS